MKLKLKGSGEPGMVHDASRKRLLRNSGHPYYTAECKESICQNKISSNYELVPDSTPTTCRNCKRRQK